MDKQELNEWYTLTRQYENGYHLSKTDIQNLRRLNHKIMNTAHMIHNDSMMGGESKNER